MIAILDYGVGNLFSLRSSLQQLGLQAVVTADADVIRAAHGLRGDALSAVYLRQLFCQCAVGRGLSVGDLQQQRPHRLSEIGADKMEFWSKVRLPA